MAKTYQCPYCGSPLSHDRTFQHTQYECPQRPGSTVKSPLPKEATCG